MCWAQTESQGGSKSSSRGEEREVPSVAPKRKGKRAWADMYHITLRLIGRERGEREVLEGRMKRECRKHQEEVSALNQKREEDKEGWKEYKTKCRQCIHALANNLTNLRKKFHGCNQLLLENHDRYDHANRVQIKTYLKFTFLTHQKFPHKSWSYYKPTEN